MATYLDYAALSALVYNDARGQYNKLPIPATAGWIELPLNSTSSITGFTAIAFRNTQTQEIVIAFKGTDSGNIVKMAQDFVFGNAAAFGGSTQLYQAALFYEQVKAQYGGNITFTGHSLGGGLASVMGVWFNKSATTFAQAPFELAAINPLAIAAAEAALVSHLYFDTDFMQFNPLNYATRQANITNYFVPGEALSKYLLLLPNVVGANNTMTVGGTSSIDSSTLHSIVLHASLLMSQTFANDTVLLPKLLTEIFDTNLYASPSLRGEIPDFLNHLLNDQIRVGYTNADGLLARFAGDIEKLTQYGANLKDGALGKALIDVAIADYYFMQAGFTRNFFNAIAGGIGFDLADIGANWSGNKTVSQLNNAIITQYLGGDQTARTFLAQDNYWSIQSGADALNATGTEINNDAMIGGTTNDTLDGGAGNDFLFGGDGTDTLTGGAGSDILIGGAADDILSGGAGYDTYTLEGRDTIRDSDGNGILKDKAGNILSGVIQKHPDGTYTYLNDPSVSVTLDANLTLTMTLADGAAAVIENFTSGKLGLQLSDNATQAPTTTITGDTIPADTDPTKAGIQAVADANGNPVGQAGAYADILGDTAGNDHILAGELSDDVGSDAGDDWIEGGAGADFLHGGTGNDIVEGGTGSDILGGEDGNDRLFADAQIVTDQAIANGATDTATGIKGDWLAGGAGEDTLIAEADNDVLSGGEGNDLLIAGAGDDYILGDTDYVPTFQWPVDANNTIDPNAWAFSMNGTNWYHSTPATFDWSVTPQADGGALFRPVHEYAPGNSPAAGNDIIHAGDGADRVWAGSGGDVVYGEAGADRLSGEGGNDILFGGAGDDTLYGDGTTASTGDDYLDGGNGNDTLWGGNGADILAGGTGDDKLYGEAGANYLEGGDGNDTLNSDGSSALYGGAGNDDLTAVGGGSYLDGGDGADTLYANMGGNELFGGRGDDSLSGAGGNNYLDDGEGNNTLLADGGGNTLLAGAGNDTLSSGGGNSYLDGGDGANTLIATGGGNTLIAGSGNDTLSSTGGNSRLEAGGGNDTLIADTGNNILIAGTGNDSLYAAGGNSRLDGGAGADTLVADGGNNILTGGIGNDALSSTGGNSTLHGGAGDDTLVADGEGNALNGDTGNDILQGDAGADILAGGEGSDELNGGDGNDIYVYNTGDGMDRIIDSNLNGQINTLRFGDGISTSNITLRLGSLMIDMGNGDEIHIDNYDPNDALNTSAIRNFEFADGTSYTAAELITTLGFDFNGTTGNDTLAGTNTTDRIAGGQGDDILAGGMGGDTYIYNAGDGNDTLADSGGYYWDPVKAEYIFKGENTLHLGAGIAADAITTRLDAVTGQITLDVAGGSINIGNVEDTAIQTLQFTAPDGQNLPSQAIGEFLSQHPLDATGTLASDTLYGTPYSDIIRGGAGNDTIQGRGGSDTYLYNPGDGADTIIDGSPYYGHPNADNNAIGFGAGITPDMVKVRRVGNDLLLDLGNGDTITVGQNLIGSDANPYGYLIPKDIAATLPINFNADPFTAISIQTLKFQDGTTLDLKDFILQQGIAKTGTAGAEYLGGESFYNPTIPGSIADRLEGGRGKDTLFGGSGDDIYVFNRGDGADTIVDATTTRWDSQWQRYLQGGSNTLEFGAGITAADITAVYQHSSWYYIPDSIAMNFGNGDSIGIGSLSDNLAIKNLRFADGSSIGISDFLMQHGLTHTSITSGWGEGWSGAYNLPNIMPGLGGNDMLYGGTMSDTFTGGVGNDYLEGRGGSDTYVYSLGDGVDFVRDDFLGANVLSFGAGISAASITPVWNVAARSLTLGLNANDKISIGSLDDLATKTLQFSDGSTLEMQDFLVQNGVVQAAGTAGNDVMATFANGLPLQGMDGDDQLYGSVLEDSLEGGAGNDLLVGNAGNDLLTGGVGSDKLEGGAGDDIYVYNLGDGADTVVESGVLDGEANTLSFGAGITADMILPVFDGSTRKLTLDLGNGDSVYIGKDGNTSIQNLRFADGTGLTLNDFIAQAGGIVQVGGAGADYLEGTQFVDRLEGLGGDDQLYGYTGSDILAGGAGNDYLSGRYGSDTYFFNRGDGADRIEDSGFGPRQYEGDTLNEVNTLVFGVGITPDMVTHSVDYWGQVILDTGNGDTVAIGYENDLAIQRILFADGTAYSAESLLYNLPPVAGQIANQLALQEAQFDFTVPEGVFVDPNYGDTLTYNATVAGGSALPSWLTFDPVMQTFSGAPGVSDAGTLSVAVTATDSGGLTATSVFDLEVASLNAAPAAVSDTIAVTEDDGVSTVAATGLLANDTDPDAGDTLALSGFDAVSAQGNAVSQDAAGDLVFDIGNNYQSLGAGQTAMDSFTYTISDAAGLASSATVDVSIAGLNDAPVAAAPIAGQQADEDAPFGFTVPANTFADIDNGDTLAYGATLADGAALPGWLAFDAATQTFSGTPGNWDVGSLNVLVTATDSGGLSATSAFALDVLNVNDAPVAADDAVATNEDAAMAPIAVAGLLANDNDIDAGDIFTLAGFDAVSANGNTVTQDASGNLEFVIGDRYQTLAAGQIATDSFGYTVADAAGATSTATVNVTIDGANDAPLAQDDFVSLPEDATQAAGGNVLANDSDVDQGTTLSVANAGVVAGSYGSLALNADGSYGYTPDNALVQSLAAGQTVTETFAYQATDGVATAPATLTAIIAGANDAPVAAAPIAGQQTDEDVPFGFTVPANTFADIDNGDTLAYGATLADGAALPGWLAFDAATQTFSGTPGNWDVGSLNVLVTATDTGGLSASSAFSLNVVNVNDAPTANADSGAASEDGGAVLLDAATLLANDTDPDFVHGDALNIVDVSQAASGAAVSLVNGAVQYDIGALFQSLAQGQTATDTFGYTVSDTAGAIGAAQVTMTVTGVNDAPVTAGDAAAVQEDIAPSATGNVLDNDSDIDQGTVLSVANAGTIAGSYGSLTLAADGSYSYVADNASPAVQSLGRDAQVAEHFGYSATDGMIGATSVLDVFLNGANDAPILVAPLADQDFTFDRHFSWQVPDGSFIDIDQGDALDYAATLADGSALPDWLNFDAATLTFSGETPKEVGFVDIRVTVTDSVAATGSTAGSLSASDVFRISVSHGNEGVGNGEDAPPPGHDRNHNDGDGTSPGRPGRRGGNGHPSASAEHQHGNEPQEHSSDGEASHGDTYAREGEDSGSDRTDELIRAWFEEESINERYSSFGALGRHGAWGGQIDRQVNRNVSEGISVDVSSEWERMNAQLKKHLDQAGGDAGIFAESGAGSRSFGLFGSGSQQGIPQLGMGSGQQMKAFAGLNEGLERLGC